LPQRPGRLVRLGKSAVSQGGREEQDEESADYVRDHEHGELVAAEQLDHERAGHRRDRYADTQDAGDNARWVIGIGSGSARRVPLEAV